MEETNNQGGEQQSNPQQDLFKGLEEKITSSFGGQEQKINDLYSSQQKLIDAINSMGNQHATKKVENENLGDLLLTDPDRAVASIEERVEARLRKQMQAESQRNQEDSKIINQLTMEFPELSDGSSDLAKAAIEIYAKLPDRDKNSSLAYETAVAKAALQVGILPKSKRKTNSDSGDFSLGSGKGGRASKGSDKIDPKTLAFAEVMARATGREVNKEYLESLAKYSNNTRKE